MENGFKWLGLSLAISVGIYFTHDANCLWAFFFGVLI